MAKTTVKDLAADLNLPVETLLSQLKEAGLSQSTPADELSEADKDRFLTSLQVARGSSNAGRRKITLTKREKSVITQNGGGSSHAVQVEVRRKRVLVKNPDVVNKAREEAKKAMEEQKEKEGELILKALQPGDVVVLLDEHGKEMRSLEFAEYMKRKMNTVNKRLVFIIGGPYGFSEKVYQAAHEKISMSKMTFSHQMIRLIFVEQIYRAMTILNGGPYHHE